MGLSGLVMCRAEICSSHSPWILLSDRLDGGAPNLAGYICTLGEMGMMAFRLWVGQCTTIGMGRLWGADVMKS